MSSIRPSTALSMTWNFGLVRGSEQWWNWHDSFQHLCLKIVRTTGLLWNQPSPFMVTYRNIRWLWSAASTACDEGSCPASALTVLDNCASFPNIYALLQILATLPVTPTEAERMFSRLERSLAAIQSTMEEQRLGALLCFRFIVRIHHQLMALSNDLVQHLHEDWILFCKLKQLIESKECFIVRVKGFSYYKICR